jgi:membrane peptidoglycan carboxypeptidase
MMEQVILNPHGTGKPARLDGYTAAGKSGTAQKIDPATGRYSRTDYNASFVGFAPVNNPAISILVTLDSPKDGHHGGQVGGPVFKRIAEQVLAYLDVPHDVPSPPDLETAINSRPSKRASEVSVAKTEASEARFEAAVAKRSHGVQTAAFGSPDSVTVPDLSGKTVRGVTESCSHLGLVPSLIGNGIAVQQFPETGTSVLRGSSVTVRFGRPENSGTAGRRNGN